ncbi:MAG: type II toxin-antitoxin system RelE/ParE family toxin [Flavobacteriaceae bacterium]|nr:type II toxin-antitoxin system RelE/ParE family toxin [Flavobacteriaceae bacterium]MCY4267652.1 type II toxin-antitoxin system RelE/ParE family toxin [Flavobacteriaceae bacterium]MCY4297945.1 type II toxin-antitoxin system RelE/ParE family toxin [Flavobacteriaceae bacterium]
MNISYKRKKLKKQLSSIYEIKKNYGNMAKRLSNRIDQLKVAKNLDVIHQFPAMNCHKLAGDREGKWAVNVSKNYRLIFELNHDPLPVYEDGILDTKSVTDICIIEVVDYH